MTAFLVENGYLEQCAGLGQRNPLYQATEKGP